MADPLMMPNEYTPELEQLAIQRKYADMLRAQSLQPIQSAGMAGRTVAPISWAQGAAQMLKAAGAGLSDQYSMQGTRDLATRMGSDRNRILAEALAKARGTPMSGTSDAADNFTMQNPGAAPDPLGGAAMLAGQNSFPDLQRIGEAGIGTAFVPPRGVAVGHSLMDPRTGKVIGTDPAFAEQKEADRKAKENELIMRLADQRITTQERQDLMRELAQMRIDAQRDLRTMALAARPEPAVTPVDVVKDGRVVKIDARTGKEIGISGNDPKLQGVFNQDTGMLNESISNMDRLAREANAIKNHPGLSKATGKMAWAPGVGGLATIPGTDAANFKARLDTLKSQVGFGVLQNMRNNSKTGGALGQVSNIEEKLLQDNLAALDRAQSPDEFKNSLERIIQYTEGAKGRLRQAYNLKHPSGAEQPAQQVQPNALSPQEQQELEQLRKRFGR